MKQRSKHVKFVTPWTAFVPYLEDTTEGELQELYRVAISELILAVADDIRAGDGDKWLKGVTFETFDASGLHWGLS